MSAPPSTKLGAALVAGLFLLPACGHGVERRRKRTSPITPTRPDSPATARQKMDALAQRHEALASRKTPDVEACEALAADYKQLHDANPGGGLRGIERAWFNAGVVWETCGDDERAAATYRAVLQAYPKFVLPMNNLGVLSWHDGQHATAMRYFERAVKIDPRATEPRTNLAAALRERYAAKTEDADFVAAEANLQNVLAVDSNNLQAYANLARIYYDRGRLDDRSYLLLSGLVVTQALRLSEVHGGSPAALHNLRGLLHMESGDQVAALRAFERSVESDPSHGDAHLNLAMVSIRFRDYARAEKSLSAVVASSEERDLTDAYLGLGVAQRGLRDYESAERSFHQARKIDKADPRALYNLGILYQEHIATNAKGKGVAENQKAKTYYENFIRAAKDRRHGEAVADARARVKTIDEYLSVVESMEELERKAKAAEAAALAEEEARRKEILDLERRALEAAAGGSS